ncbi:protein kinase activating protein dpb11 [Neurospora sp. IMI 360204]|nr:protein kinase activating protein dpb11 [Neurospora sp. IMI 360204]
MSSHPASSSRAGSPSSDNVLFDPSHPLKGVVVCCTSISPELRTDIANKIEELGGKHKHDLTPDCTHLIVGEYDTPKYRHVAKERPDVKAMAAGWIEALRKLWVQDADIDFIALEKEWELKPFETGGGEPNLVHGTTEPRRKLLICSTGFMEAEERQHIIDMVEKGGGMYTGDLTRRVTHLVVYKPEGRKYQAAQNWGIRTVSVEWINDCVDRGLILDEKSYDPLLPHDERGLGAWNRQSSRVPSLGKRLRESAAEGQEAGRRKLRKTASIKLNSQRDSLWGSILGVPPAATSSPAAPPAALTGASQAQPPASAPPQQPSGSAQSVDTQGSRLSSFGIPHDEFIFAYCCFYVAGFAPKETEILTNTVASLGGVVCQTLDECASASGAQMAHRFLVVPQNSQPDSHPRLPPTVYIITEFYIERCLHKKYFFDPNEHVLGRPFSSFPIPDFNTLSVSTAGFTGVDLNHVDKAIRQLGARYEQRFTADVSVLVAPSVSVIRKQKLDMALLWKVPIVRAEWLWMCINTGFKCPIEDFLFPELNQKIRSEEPPTSKGSQVSGKDKATEKQTKQSKLGSVDVSDFTSAIREKMRSSASASKSTKGTPALATALDESHDSYETAPSQRQTSTANTTPGKKKSAAAGAPLTDISNLSQPASSSKQKQKQQPPRKPLSRIRSEIADSDAESAADDDVPLPGEDDLPVVEGEPGKRQQSKSPSKLRALEEEPVIEDPGETGEELRRRLLREAEEKKKAEKLKVTDRLVDLLLDAGGDGEASVETVAATSFASALSHSLGGRTTSITAVEATEARAMTRATRAPSEAVSVRSDDGSVASKTRRRKREILGRAMSNVSAASEDGLAADAPPDGGELGRQAKSRASTSGRQAQQKETTPPAAPATTTATTTTKRKTRSKKDDKEGPPPTQIDYQDIDSRKARQKLLSKLGDEGATDTGSISKRAAEEQKTMSIGDLNAFVRENEGHGIRSPTGLGRTRNGERGYGGRTTRRSKGA